MGFWNLLFGKSVKIDDAFFGELLLMEVKSDPSKSYFEGWRHFKPTGEKVEVGVSGGREGPTQVQKDFFRQVEADYFWLVQRIIPLIEKAFRRWQVDFEAADFGQDFKPVYLFIPDCVETPIGWELAFESVLGLVKNNYPYTVIIEMIDYEPQHVSISQ